MRAGSFYICFDVARSATGWLALDCLTWVAGEFGTDRRGWLVTITTWTDAASPARGATSFELRGRNVLPDEVAECLANAVWGTPSAPSDGSEHAARD